MKRFLPSFLIVFYLFFVLDLNAKTDKYRVMWRDDPATTMVIGWNQISGSGVAVYYDVNDFGKDVLAYQNSAKPIASNRSKGMNNNFVRLTNLIPSTTYYFVVKDSEGCSERMSFETAPDNPEERLSIIAGGDSRNYRKARQKANSLVAKLRPHCVMFGGDMTGGDNATQWKGWFDDWQLTKSEDGRMTPIIVTRGNHEYSNKTLTDLFDVAPPNAYYALSIGGDLLRIYTLNSLIPSGGNQKKWLENDLIESQNYTWRFAQYHFATRPHTAKKSERNNQLRDWSTLFEKYKVQLAVESDAHCVKWTYPIRPSREQGSQQGFIRDDVNGTVYVGEGCWGAPLRKNNDDKIWTRNSGSFNQFKWIFVDQQGIEIRTIKTDGADLVNAVDPWDIFTPPAGLELWNPSNGPVVRIDREPALANYNFDLSKEGANPFKEFIVANYDVSNSEEGVVIKWNTENEKANNHVFQIEKSYDGVHFEIVSEIDSKGEGNNDYSFFETRSNAIGDKVSYRLKEKIGEDAYQIYGTRLVSQSPTDHTLVSKSAKMNKLIPETGNGMIRAKYVVDEPADIAIRLTDNSKKVIAKSDYKNQVTGNYLQSIDMKHFPEGQYMLTIQAGEEVIKKYLVVK